MSKTFAVGDIHGCHDALSELIAWIDPDGKHKLVFLGDYVHRGPDSVKVVDWMMDQSGRRDMVCLRGNHEIMWVQEQRERIRTQRLEDSGSWDKEWDVDQGSWRTRHFDFFDLLLDYYETKTHIFVHACLYGDLPMDQQPEYMLHWEKFESMTRPESRKKVICGHTSQKTGVPLENDFAVCIDTNCCRGGWLTALDVESGRYYQTNQDCERRDGWLEKWLSSVA